MHHPHGDARGLRQLECQDALLVWAGQGKRTLCFWVAQSKYAESDLRGVPPHTAEQTMCCHWHCWDAARFRWLQPGKMRPGGRGNVPEFWAPNLRSPARGRTFVQEDLALPAARPADAVDDAGVFTEHGKVWQDAVRAAPGVGRERRPHKRAAAAAAVRLLGHGDAGPRVVASLGVGGVEDGEQEAQLVRHDPRAAHAGGVPGTRGLASLACGSAKHTRACLRPAQMPQTSVLTSAGY